jgi:hypothetical protein
MKQATGKRLSHLSQPIPLQMKNMGALMMAKAGKQKLNSQFPIIFAFSFVVPVSPFCFRAVSFHFLICVAF